MQGKRAVTPGENTADTHSVRGFMGTIASQGILEKRKILASAGSQPQIVQNISWFMKHWVPLYAFVHSFVGWGRRK